MCVMITNIFLFFGISDNSVTKIDIGSQRTNIAFEKIDKMKKIEENFGFLKIK